MMMKAGEKSQTLTNSEPFVHINKRKKYTKPIFLGFSTYFKHDFK